MKEKELKGIIDREKHKKDVRRVFPEQIDLLVDLVNYGSNLIVRAFDSSSKKLEDIIIIAVLLKQVVSMVDAVEILVSHGSVLVAHLQIRTAFEASLYIDWILKEESEKKAKYYYVSNIRNQRLWALRYLPGTPENEIFSQYTSDIQEHLKARNNKNVEDVEIAKLQIKDMERTLDQKEYRQINDEFERRKAKTSREEAYWYRPLGIKSIREMAEETGRLSEYIVFYSTGSKYAHIQSYTEHVKFNRGVMRFEPIRQLGGANSIIQNMATIALSSYEAILRHYRFGELKSFSRKYKSDWQKAFQNVPKVSYIEEGN